MKKLFIFCIVLLFWSGTAAADIGRDKYMHTGACAAISASTNLALAHIWPDLPQAYRILAAVSASMLVGIGKELTDEYIDREDLAANFTGALLGLSFTIEW